MEVRYLSFGKPERRVNITVLDGEIVLVPDGLKLLGKWGELVFQVELKTSSKLIPLESHLKEFQLEIRREGRPLETHLIKDTLHGIPVSSISIKDVVLFDQEWNPIKDIHNFKHLKDGIWEDGFLVGGREVSGTKIRDVRREFFGENPPPLSVISKKQREESLKAVPLEIKKEIIHLMILNKLPNKHPKLFKDLLQGIEGTGILQCWFEALLEGLKEIPNPNHGHTQGSYDNQPPPPPEEPLGIILRPISKREGVIEGENEKDEKELKSKGKKKEIEQIEEFVKIQRTPTLKRSKPLVDLPLRKRPATS